jgi:hypothetical protein
MTFDQYANQGDTAAWDPDAAAANKRAADKIFTVAPDGAVEDGAVEDGAVEDGAADEAEDDTSMKQDPHPPSEVPDPDISND